MERGRLAAGRRRPRASLLRFMEVLCRVRWGNVGRLAALLAAGVLIASGLRDCGPGERVSGGPGAERAAPEPERLAGRTRPRQLRPVAPRRDRRPAAKSRVAAGRRAGGGRAGRRAPAPERRAVARARPEPPAPARPAPARPAPEPPAAPPPRPPPPEPPAPA